MVSVNHIYIYIYIYDSHLPRHTKFGPILSSGFGDDPETLNPLKSELIPICYLLALLGAHHFLNVSRIRVKLLTFRLLMS